MKIRTSLVHLTAPCFLTYGPLAQKELPQAHIVSLLSIRRALRDCTCTLGFVSSVRLPEEVRSVVSWRTPQRSSVSILNQTHGWSSQPLAAPFRASRPAQPVAGLPEKSKTLPCCARA
jgi:hypothetical protein